MNRERGRQYKRLEAKLGSVKSLKYCYHLPMKMQKGNILQASVILSMGGHVSPPPPLYCWQVRSTHPYCNAVLFKLALNCEMYSWVVHFLNYFIFSISERDVETERREEEGDGKVFFCK